MKNNNIFLIGFMGAGKSTIARTLQAQYDMKLVEMDEQIEAEEGMKISEIFAQKGESYFRSLETQMLESMQHQEHTVVSCGGGVPMRECNVEAMRKSGKIVYLSAKPETIYERVRHFHTRPLLEGNMNVDYITQLMDMRMPKYLSAADFIVETDGKQAEEISEEIVRKVK
jgi:shikimate kinase